MKIFWVRNAYAMAALAVGILVVCVQDFPKPGDSRNTYQRNCRHSTRVELVLPDSEQQRLLCLKQGKETGDLAKLLHEGQGCSLPEGYIPFDGEQLIVRKIKTGDGHDSCAFKRTRIPGAGLLTLGIKIDINNADIEDLEALPGIGPVLASRIIENVNKAPFKSVRELLDVKGIGPIKLDRIAGMITVGNMPRREKRK
ncbi:MAG: helix-hairpin-helix domain-containing protein [Deltaproteobacteria bacterium]|nr:helix-hairpin-helix domain-containing protein [Deltaproteobacteria bacterium]